MAIFSRSQARKAIESQRAKKCLLRKASISMPKLSLKETWAKTLIPWAKDSLSTPVRTQTGSNCVPFAAQTALEVLLNKRCPLVDVAPKNTHNNGMAMCVYWNDTKVMKALAHLDVTAEVVCLRHVERTDKILRVKDALRDTNVAIIGANVPMVTDKHSVRTRCYERHSVTVVGFLEDYLVLRDTQGGDYGKCGLTLLEIEGLDIEELVVISKSY